MERGKEKKENRSRLPRKLLCVFCLFASEEKEEEKEETVIRLAFLQSGKGEKEEAECFVGQEEIKKKAERKSGSNRSESFFARSIEREVAANGAKKLFSNSK